MQDQALVEADMCVRHSVKKFIQVFPTATLDARNVLHANFVAIMFAGAQSTA